MKCFYHSDHDGKASAYCIYHWASVKPQSFPYKVDFIMMDYGKPFPIHLIDKDEQVFIVDFSIQPEEMDKLLQITQDVTWIDHHKTAIDKYEGFRCNIKGIRRIDESACVLTWKYLNWWSKGGMPPYVDEKLITSPDYCPEDKKENVLPRVIELVGDYDMWWYKHGDETRRLQAALCAYDTSPWSNIWRKCIEDAAFWQQLQGEGELVLRYKDNTSREMRESISFPVIFEGYKCLAMNAARCNSDTMGGEESFKTYDILMPFFYDGKQFTISLYSRTVDVSEIAKKFGGGGHKQAAGFQSKELPYYLQTDRITKE